MRLRKYIAFAGMASDALQLQRDGERTDKQIYG